MKTHGESRDDGFTRYISKFHCKIKRRFLSEKIEDVAESEQIFRDIAEIVWLPHFQNSNSQLRVSQIPTTLRKYESWYYLKPSRVEDTSATCYAGAPIEKRAPEHRVFL